MVIYNETCEISSKDVGKDEVFCEGEYNELCMDPEQRSEPDLNTKYSIWNDLRIDRKGDDKTLNNKSILIKGSSRYDPSDVAIRMIKKYIEHIGDSIEIDIIVFSSNNRDRYIQLQKEYVSSYGNLKFTCYTMYSDVLVRDILRRLKKQMNESDKIINKTLIVFDMDLSNISTHIYLGHPLHELLINYYNYSTDLIFVTSNCHILLNCQKNYGMACSCNCSPYITNFDNIVLTCDNFPPSYHWIIRYMAKINNVDTVRKQIPKLRNNIIIVNNKGVTDSGQSWIECSRDFERFNDISREM